MSYNTTFKRPAVGAASAARSPSPPRRFVEPLSPAKPKPKPIEPHFNYPAITDSVNFQVPPEQPFTATPKARAGSAGYRSAHHRTPSTIDTLAEAALALSPSRPAQGSSPTYSGYAHVPVASNSHGHHEPPHKRARSEICPSPMVGQYASRPATSYEQSQGWAGGFGQQYHAGYAQDRSLEEAALLLNFRTSGWSTNHTGHASRAQPTAPTPAVPRPHASSFPQASHPSRPIELTAPAPLLPPFNPQDGAMPRPTLPSPQQTVEDFDASPKRNGHAVQQAPVSYEHLAGYQHDVDMTDAPQQTRTSPEGETSRATSMDVTVSESSESTCKLKRGWPKGKSRASCGRKSIAEKAASGRVASRKKSAARSKTSKQATQVASTVWNVRPDVNRRKSFSDAVASVGHTPAGGLDSRAQSVPPDTSMMIRPASPSKAQRRPKEAVPDTVCASCEVSRETIKANPEVDAWVSCNGCKKWFHIDCAGFKKASEVRDVDKYFCVPCEPTHGKTTYKRKSRRAHAQVDYSELQRGVLKTSEESMEHHYIQPIKDGTFVFDPENFPRMRPELVTREFFEKSGTFTEPICIPVAWNPQPWLKRRQQRQDQGGSADLEDEFMSDLIPGEFEYDAVPDEGQDKLDMVMPEDLTVRQVCNLVGPETPLDVIDVKTQNSGAKWTLGRWADYYEEQSDDKPIQNVISLEVSQSKLGRLLRRPKIVRDIDLQDEVWPQEEKDKGKWPKVQYYCLMSAADSYTDFHIDFGGSSVYYHILRGQKTFFFIPPKAKHLKAYEEWNDSPQQNYTFLPNITKECYRVDLYAGDTMLIPSGWIHAVWTPATSLVIGGNFLNRLSYKNQFKVVEIEKANETPMKFRYPYFQKLMWYTAIKYLKDDPLPPAVSQAFYDGKRYERQQPVWADFDGEIAANDDRPGAKNARYYSQAEIDGLPELANFIFRTVMLVLGRIEGTSQDRIKRVNASIPKGHGEPLDVAKTFALWVAWKRGDEDPPAWAHPDAVLPNSSKEDSGAPKKLSQRALKDMERKEAIAAWRVAPDRQSERVRNSAAAAAAAAVADHASAPNPNKPATPDRAPRTSFAPSRQPSATTTSNSTCTSTAHHTHARAHPPDMAATAPMVAPPMAFMVNAMPGQHLSTPKTSVLGPKRVACDACRKRRIRCKHKSEVVELTPQHIETLQQLTPGAPAGHDIRDNINVTPSKTNHHFAPDSSDFHQSSINGSGPLPGTNAYINANIPMTMNGVPIFGDAQKRGRTKACFECRKSKRRCVHDENGNVDPVKAAETPVPRGSNASKKRPSRDENTPIQPKKKLKAASPVETAPQAPAFPQQSPTTTHSQTPQPHTNGTSAYPSHSYEPHHIQHDDSRHPSHDDQSSQPPVDPSLFTYSEPEAHQEPYENQYAYSAAEAYSSTEVYSSAEAYSSAERPPLYAMPSLEQIANDCLNMDGHGDYAHDHEENVHVYHPNSIAPMPHGLPSDPCRPDEAVDSGISLGGSETSENRPAQKQDELSTSAPAAQTPEDIPGPSSQNDAKSVQAADSNETRRDSQGALPSIEGSAKGHPDTLQGSPSASKVNVNSLPLYRHPGPPSAAASPELSRRQLANGSAHSPSHDSNSSKRTRDQNSETPPKNSKKAKRTFVTAGED